MTGGNINIGASSIGSGNPAITIGKDSTGSTRSLSLRTLGTLNLGNNASTINIGNTNTTGNINMGQALTTGNINMGQALTTGGIFIGNSLSSITLGGTTATVIASAVSSIVNLFNNLTTGIINMGTSMTSGFSTGEINIGTLTAGSGPKVFIYGSLFSLIATSINIGANITTIINLGVASVSTAFIYVNNPMKPLYNLRYAVTATTGGTPTGCIGNYIYATTPAGALALTSPAVRLCATFTNLPIGVWLLYWTLDVNCPTTAAGITNIGMTMATSTLGTDILTNNCEAANFTLAVGRTRSYTQTQIYTNLVATTDIYFSMAATFTGTLTQEATSFENCKALRIA